MGYGWGYRLRGTCGSAIRPNGTARQPRHVRVRFSSRTINCAEMTAIERHRATAADVLHEARHLVERQAEGYRRTQVPQRDRTVSSR